MDYLEIYLRAIREPIDELQESFDAELQLISSFIKPKSITLDVGCGAARSLRLLSPFAKKLVGIDNDKRVLEIARKECRDLSNIDILFGDALALPFDDETFDVTFSAMNTIGTFSSYQQYKFVKEMVRVTKSSGHIINTTWRTDRGALENIHAYYEHYYQEEGYEILEIDETKTVTVKGTFERISEKDLRELYKNAEIQNVSFHVLGPLFLGVVGTK